MITLNHIFKFVSHLLDHTVQQWADHRLDLSLKLTSAELVEVSWLIFMEESDTETSDDRVDLDDDNSDREVDMVGDSRGS